MEDYRQTSTEMQEAPMFIDQYEIEEMLGEYYDFSSLGNADWRAIDDEVKKLCRERGVSPTESDYTEYARICDACCEKLGIAKAG